MAKDFEHILDECIERLLQGESVEQCLQAYPEQAAELEPLLRVALAARKASAIEPRPEFKAQARYRIQSALHAEKKKPQPRRIPFLGWRPRWAVAVVVSLLVLFLAGGGVVAASSNSLPDETLYPVKLARERVQMALTFSEMGKAKLRMKFANKRIQEIARMVEKGKSAQEIEKAAMDLAPRVTASLERVRRLVEAERRKAEESQQLIKLRLLLEQNKDKSQTILQEIENNAPPRLAIEEFIRKSRMGYQQALQAAGATVAGEPNVDAALQLRNRQQNQTEAADLQSLEIAVRTQAERSNLSTGITNDNNMHDATAVKVPNSETLYLVAAG